MPAAYAQPRRSSRRFPDNAVRDRHPRGRRREDPQYREGEGSNRERLRVTWAIEPIRAGARHALMQTNPVEWLESLF
jgi:hypothetical protein